MVDRLGLRRSVTLAALLVAIGSSLRCITTKAPYALILANLGQILNAAGGPLVLATPAKLSATWFPPEHRTTATSVAVMSNYLGSGYAERSALIGPSGHALALPLRLVPQTCSLLTAAFTSSVYAYAYLLTDSVSWFASLSVFAELASCWRCP